MSAVVSSRIRNSALSALAGLFVLAGADAAHATNKVGWVWADQPDASGPYTPDTSYSFNSTGGSITVTPLSQGQYLVDFDGLAGNDPSNVQITAYGTSGYCQSTGWIKGFHGIAEASVQCFGAKGDPQNSYFTLLYQQRSAPVGNSADKSMAYLLADQPGAANYTPNANFNYNATGTPNSVTRNGTGDYVAHLPGLVQSGGNVQVTAVDSSGAGARCKIGANGWQSGATETFVSVACFDDHGAAADKMFSLAYTLHEPYGLTTEKHSKGAYGYAHKPKSLHAYNVYKPFAFSTLRAGAMTSQKTAAGTYSVNFRDSLPSFTSSLVLVTSDKSAVSNAYCNVIEWFPIDVQCFKQGGNPIDATFNVTYQTAE